MVDSSEKLEELSFEETVGQLLHVGIGLENFETPAGWPDEEMETVLEEIQPGAVRVYGNHAATPHFMAQYTNQLQRWAESTTHGIPLLLSCDCEYGAVDIVGHEARAYPALMGRTATGDIDLARDTSAAIARAGGSW
jgi:beta-N-acetylhexosaminidase